MMVETVLVTGATSGIGFEFVKQFVELQKPPRFVFATYRDESKTKALKETRNSSKCSKIVLIKMDVTKMDEIGNACNIIESMVGENGLDLLINNAEAIKLKTFAEITKENMLFHFCTNSIGPIMAFKEMLPLLQKKAVQETDVTSISRKVVLNISSTGGSIAGRSEEEFKQFLEAMSYRVSKAALNMAMRMIAQTVKDKDILVVNMCPGRVRTGMSRHPSGITPFESVSAILITLSQLNESHQGAFLDRYGNRIPF